MEEERKFFNEPPKDRPVNEIDQGRVVKGYKALGHFSKSPIYSNFKN